MSAQTNKALFKRAFVEFVLFSIVLIFFLSYFNFVKMAHGRIFPPTSVGVTVVGLAITILAIWFLSIGISSFLVQKLLNYPDYEQFVKWSKERGREKLHAELAREKKANYSLILPVMTMPIFGPIVGIVPWTIYSLFYCLKYGLEKFKKFINGNSPNSPDNQNRQEKFRDTYVYCAWITNKHSRKAFRAGMLAGIALLFCAYNLANNLPLIASAIVLFCGWILFEYKKRALVPCLIAAAFLAFVLIRGTSEDALILPAILLYIYFFLHLVRGLLDVL